MYNWCMDSWLLLELPTWKRSHSWYGQRQPLVLKLYSARINLRDMKFQYTLSWFRIFKRILIEFNVKFLRKDGTTQFLISFLSFAGTCHCRRHLNGANRLEQINIWSLSAVQNLPEPPLSYLLRQEGVAWSASVVKIRILLWLLLAALHSLCHSLVLLCDFLAVPDTSKGRCQKKNRFFFRTLS